MLDYSEYTSLIDLLEKTSLDDTYKELMKKEDKVLDTVKHVVTHHETEQRKRKEFIHLSLHEIYHLMFLEMPQIVKELNNAKDIHDVMSIIFKGHRVIYIGILLVLLSVFLFFIEHSR